jgi:hypothetical protein
MGETGVKRAAILGLGVLLLAACSGPQYPTTAQPANSSTPQPPPRPHLRPLPPQVSVKDQCGAAALQGLVGRPRTEIPVPVDPNRQRVACTACPVTLDYNPGRLNFFFDAETGLIKEIRCG